MLSTNVGVHLLRGLVIPRNKWSSLFVGVQNGKQELGGHECVFGNHFHSNNEKSNFLDRELQVRHTTNTYLIYGNKVYSSLI
mmetsp:Transcript_12594/g.25237  ORF Transcript_12594/g.25237 Transcript_12594/m.25237 type:complete len:82 (+) Transcript_12594:1551-1796(+)